MPSSPTGLDAFWRHWAADRSLERAGPAAPPAFPLPATGDNAINAGGGKWLVSSTAYEPESIMSLHVPHERSSAARVRGELAAHLRANHVAGAPAEDSLLIVSELVTNAVRHARPLPTGKLQVSWWISPIEIRLSVADGGASTVPVAAPAAMWAQGGRGLNIVRQLANCWDVACTPEGTTVCAVIGRAGHP